MIRISEISPNGMIDLTISTELKQCYGVPFETDEISNEKFTAIYNNGKLYLPGSGRIEIEAI